MLDFLPLQCRRVNLKGRFAADPLGARPAAGYDQRFLQHIISVGFKTECLVHQHRRDAAAVRVHIIPDGCAHAGGVVGLAFITGVLSVSRASIGAIRQATRYLRMKSSSLK